LILFGLFRIFFADFYSPNLKKFMTVEIREVSFGRLQEFIKFPWKVYAGDPNWVPHLLVERKEFLDPKKNPFFEHTDIAFYLAYRNGELAGRIAAIVNHAHNQFHQDQVGFFGMFECFEDAEVASALIEKAKEFLRHHGMTSMRGPVNLSTNDECGLLVEGLNEPAQIMMTYNPSYYVKLLENCGFQKAKDLLAHRVTVPKEVPERLQRGVDLIMKRNEFTIRTFNMKDFQGEVQRIKKIYNAAWERNWGFIPMTDAEFDHMGAQMKQIIDPDFIFIAEHKGTPIAFSITIPNLNEAIIKLRDGRLLPFGLIKLLWNSRKGKLKSVRVITLGILKEHRNSGIDVVFYHKSFETAIRKGYVWAEMSWILEDNTAMNRALERMGAQVYRKYRLYEMPLK
jgi:GNAT superfamily N-acetyltransferase